jgi:hypothetical protein
MNERNWNSADNLKINSVLKLNRSKCLKVNYVNFPSKGTIKSHDYLAIGNFLTSANKTIKHCLIQKGYTLCILIEVLRVVGFEFV